MNRFTVNEKLSVQAIQPKRYSDESKDGGTTAGEKKNNLIDRRYSQRGGRAVDDFCGGGRS